MSRSTIQILLSQHYSQNAMDVVKIEAEMLQVNTIHVNNNAVTERLAAQ